VLLITGSEKYVKLGVASNDDHTKSHKNLSVGSKAIKDITIP
jgi:hypothetical protein